MGAAAAKSVVGFGSGAGAAKAATTIIAKIAWKKTKQVVKICKWNANKWILFIYKFRVVKIELDPQKFTPNKKHVTNYLI